MMGTIDMQVAGIAKSSRTGLAYRGSKIPRPVNGDPPRRIPIAPMCAFGVAYRLSLVPEGNIISLAS